MTSRGTPERGAQTHAEGEPGHTARGGNRDRLQHRDDDLREREMPPVGDPNEGGHRIYEDRQQHDEDDSRSEKNRLAHNKDKRGKGRGSPGGESRR